MTMKIRVTEILPQDDLVLPDGSTKRAAFARSAGPHEPVEVQWADGSDKGVFPRDAMLVVVGRLHMAVPSEQEERELAEHIAWHRMGHGKDRSMTDSL